MFLKYEDLEHNKYETFIKTINFINNIKGNKFQIDEKKLLNSIKSTNFTNLRNKEQNEGFEESITSRDGEKKPFFNLGFKNKWDKILPKNIINQLNKNLQSDLNNLGYDIYD